ncbi:hypothetical protein IFR05_003343 [Cadophora sp. M221]|nr:hypothetical protein IFR05_003343 [Cadophora sp. M221]
MNSTSTVVGAGHPDSIAYRIIIIAVVFPLLAFVLLSARLYTRYLLVKRVDFSDYWIVVGFLCSLVYSTLQIAQTWNGVGKHIWDVPLEDFQLFMRLGSLVGITAYTLGTLFTKLSILLFYLQFSAYRRIRFVVYVVMFVAIGYNLSGILAPFYLCTPMRRYWNFSVKGKCLSINAYFIASSAINAATDVAMLLLPIWLLRPLTIPKRQKIGVIVVLMMGSFVTIVSIVRLALIPGGLHDTDVTWHYVKNLNLIILEMHVGVICACLTSLKPLIKAYFPSFFEDRFPIPDSSLGTLPPFQPPTQQIQELSFSDYSGYQTISNKDRESKWKSAAGKEGQILVSPTILSGLQRPQPAHVVHNGGNEPGNIEL